MMTPSKPITSGHDDDQTKEPIKAANTIKDHNGSKHEIEHGNKRTTTSFDVGHKHDKHDEHDEHDKYNEHTHKHDGQHQHTIKGNEKTAIDLCTGCGGLALATRNLGYKHLALIESNNRCALTLQVNGFHNVVRESIQRVDYRQYKGRVTLMTAGLPCQPWSVGGLMRGEIDSRNLWKDAVRAIKECKPETLLFEMVHGFMLPQFEKTRTWVDDSLKDLGYQTEWHEVNAKDYGLPQHRRRCLLIGITGRAHITPPTTLDKVSVRDMMTDLGQPNGENRHDVRGV